MNETNIPEIPIPETPKQEISENNKPIEPIVSENNVTAYKPVNPIRATPKIVPIKSNGKEYKTEDAFVIINRQYHMLLIREKERTGVSIKFIVEKMIMDAYGKKSTRLDSEIEKKTLEKIKEELTVSIREKYKVAFNNNIIAIKERNALILKYRTRIKELEAKVKIYAKGKSDTKAGIDSKPDGTEEAGKSPVDGEPRVLQGAQDTNQGQPEIHNTNSQ